MEEKEEELTDKTSRLTPSSTSVVIPKSINNYDSNASSMVETIDKKKRKTIKKIVNATIKNKQSLISRNKTANTSAENPRIVNLTKTVGEIKAHLRKINDHKKIIKNMAKSLISGASGSFIDDNSFRRIQQSSSESSPKVEKGIPTTMETPLSHDVKHIVNNVFRKRLQADLPGNKRKLFDDQHFREHLKHIEDIRLAEKNVMEVQERLLNNCKMGGDTELDYLNPSYVNKYSLIQMRTFDADGAVDEIAREESVGHCKTPVYGIHGELRRLRLRLNKERPRFERLCESRITDMAPKQLPRVVKKNGAFLRTNPSIIRFYDYEPGWIYSTTVDIQNTGNRIVPFKIITRKDIPNEFDFDYYPKGPLAPGMCSKITVNFDCRSYEDKFGIITLIEEGNYVTNLFIMAENYKPILRYTIKSFDWLPGMYEKKSSEEDLSEMFVFECHACLVGTSKTIDVVVKNLGRSSIFICVSEDFWYLKAVEDLELDELRLDSFVVTPSVFKIRYNESILLKVTFKPLMPSFHCAKMIIVSDNSCAQEVNIFGDGQSFDTNSFRLKGLGLEPTTAQTETAMTRRYILDLGEISSQIVRCVYVKNTRIKCPYRWVVNHSFDTSSSKEAAVNFNVYPSKGMLNANSETEFQFMCSVTDTIVDQQLTGKYQVFVSLFIDDIPKISLVKDDGTVLKIENEANPEVTSLQLVSVRVAVLEVISEYNGKEYINLDAYPKIVDLNSYQYKLGDGVCVEETVHFKNNGKLPVTVSWIRPDEHSCVDNDCSHDYDSHSVVNFEVVPGSLVVDDRAKVRVLIDPRGSGHLRHILRFRATNIDGSSDMVVYVRGLIEPQEVMVRPTTLPRLGILCTGTLATYRTEFTSWMNNFELITKRLYRFNGDDRETWLPYSEQSFGSYAEGTGVKNMNMTINYETVVNTQTNGISCELTEWTFAECHTVYNQTVAVVKSPDVQFNQRTVSFHRPLYKGITRRHKGICLFNNTRCGLTYCWGYPLETVANNVHCWLEPANGVVDGESSVEFELIVIPKTAGLHSKFTVPCFIQNAAVPEQITVEFTVKGFAAEVSYVDSMRVHRKIQWPADYEEQWSDDINGHNETYGYENIEAEDYCLSDDTVLRMPPNQSFKFELFEENEFEPEDQEPAKWQGRDALSAPLNSEILDSKLYSRIHPIAFRDLQCNIVSRQQITIRNITDIPCRCLSSIKNFGLLAINYACQGDRIPEPDEILEMMKASDIYCAVWLDVVDCELAGQAEFILSVNALATVWGEYVDEVSIELLAGDDVLPAIRIPIAVFAVTYPVEFPLATPPGPVASANFSLYSMNTSIRLKIRNKSEMPIHVSWLLYNKSYEKQPFSVLLDMLTPDFPDPWSFRIMPHYGSTSQYFKDFGDLSNTSYVCLIHEQVFVGFLIIAKLLNSVRYMYQKVDPITLELEPNESDFVTFSLDRTQETYVKRNNNNIVFGQAIGIVTAVKFPENNCNRVTGFIMQPVRVDLQSETRHSLQPNFLLREPDNIFQVQAVQIYRSQDSYHKVTRRFTLLNLLRYPATIFFEADKPFCISAVRTLRCGTRSGNAAIRVIYEDLIRVDIDAEVTVKNCTAPKMPANGTSRKIVLSGCLYAKCIDSMATPSIVSRFKLHIHFPVLKLSAKNINFGQTPVRDTKSETVKLSSYSGAERFLAYSGNDVFEISPSTGTVDVNLPVALTVKFVPRSDVRYSHSIIICTAIPMDFIVLEVCGTGVK